LVERNLNRYAPLRTVTEKAAWEIWKIQFSFYANMTNIEGRCYSELIGSGKYDMQPLYDAFNRPVNPSGTAMPFDRSTCLFVDAYMDTREIFQDIRDQHHLECINTLSVGPCDSWVAIQSTSRVDDDGSGDVVQITEKTFPLYGSSEY
jgi:hypothetical protein